MLKSKSFKVFRNTVLVGLAFLLSFSSPLAVSAISSTQLYEFAQNNILFYAPDGTDSCVTVGSMYVENVTGKNVSILGDAGVLNGGLLASIKQKMPDALISTLSNLVTDWSSAIESSSSRGLLVLAFGGTDNAAFDSAQFLQALTGKNIKVIAATYYGVGTLNDSLRTMAQDNENINLMDFAAAVEASPDKYTSNGTLTSAGYELYATMMYDAVKGLTVVNTNSGNTGGSVGLAEYQLEFVDEYHDIAAGLSLQYGIPWESVIAQGILESRSGTSNFAVNRNNFFGIGAFDSNPDNAFSYETPAEGWRGYYENIRRTSVYRNNGVFQGATITDPYEYIVAVKQAGYATDPEYVSKLHPIIASIEKYSAQKGWASSAQIASANPEWYERAAKNAEGAGEPSGNINYSGYFCLDTTDGQSSSSPNSATGVNTVPSTIVGESDKPVTGVRISESSSVACDPRTTDIGVYEGYLDGQKLDVRLCLLDHPGYQIKGDPGGLSESLTKDFAAVNSIVSGAFAALGHIYYEETHQVLVGTSGFRTNEYQKYLREVRYAGTSQAAKPGYSNHQAGLALDIVTGCDTGIAPGSCGSTMDKWLTRVVGGYNQVGSLGLVRPVSYEAWHVQMPKAQMKY